MSDRRKPWLTPAVIDITAPTRCNIELFDTDDLSPDALIPMPSVANPDAVQPLRERASAGARARIRDRAV